MFYWVSRITTAISLKFAEVAPSELTLQCRYTALYLRVQLLVDHVVLSSLLPCLHRAWSKLGCGWLWISPNHSLTTAPVLNHMTYLNQSDVSFEDYCRYRGGRTSCMYHVLHNWVLKLHFQLCSLVAWVLFGERGGRGGIGIRNTYLVSFLWPTGYSVYMTI